MIYVKQRVTDPFLRTFYYVEKRNGILRKNRGRDLKNLTYPYMGVGGIKNCQNYPYVINEWSLTSQYTVEEEVVNEPYLDVGRNWRLWPQSVLLREHQQHK